MRLALLILFAASLAQAAPRRLSEADVRAFVDRQSRAWNAGDLRAYFSLFASDATFTDQARARDGRIVPYGTSTLTQAKAQTRRARATSQVRETTTIHTIRIAPDGRSARLDAWADTTITRGGRTRRLCAERDQALVATLAGVRSEGQIDTYVRCR